MFKVPESTLNGWVARRKAKVAIRAPRRPTTLTSEEEKVVADSVCYLRNKGAPVDREVLQDLGRRAMSEVC